MIHMEIKDLHVLFGKSCTYKSKYNLKLFELKYGEFYLKNEVRVQLQSLLVQLSWRVACG